MANEETNRRILGDLEPGTKVILEMEDGSEVTGRIESADDGAVALSDQGPVSLDDVSKIMLAGVTLDA
jgi:hypothetical protein